MPDPLRLIVWQGMPDPDALADAGHRIGYDLDTRVVSSNEDLERLLEAEPPFDLICPSDYLVEKLAAEGRLGDLDEDLQARRTVLEDWSRSPAWDPDERYSFPLAFGTTGLLHSTSRAPGLDSWSGFFSPGDGVPVGLLSEMREVVGAALIAAGRSPNEGEERSLRDAAGLLELQRPFVRAISSEDFTGPVERGEVAIHQAWSGPSSMAVRRTAGLRYAVPKEGALLWVTAAAIPIDASDPEAANRLLAELTDPGLAVQAVANGGYSTPNRAARRKLPALLERDEVLFPDEDTIRRSATLKSLEPEAEAALAEMWAGFATVQARERAVDSRI